MIDAVQLEKDYHQLIEMLVCSRDLEIFMIHRCSSCPRKESLEAYLQDSSSKRADFKTLPVSDDSCTSDSDNEKED